jgi:hypothetical protein
MVHVVTIRLQRVNKNINLSTFKYLSNVHNMIYLILLVI